MVHPFLERQAVRRRRAASQAMYVLLDRVEVSILMAGLKVAGPTGRFKRMLMKKVHQAGGEEGVDDEDVGRVLRQTLWQWGYELTNEEYRRAMEEE